MEDLTTSIDDYIKQTKEASINQHVKGLCLTIATENVIERELLILHPPRIFVARSEPSLLPLFRTVRSGY